MTKKQSGKKLDGLDCRLIQLLQKDGRMASKALAGELGTSEFTVRRRLRRLLEEGTMPTPSTWDLKLPAT